MSKSFLGIIFVQFFTVISWQFSEKLVQSQSKASTKPASAEP